jgi:predicted Zn-dependent peptidase
MAKIKKTILKNGIVVATEEMPDVYSASIGVWVDTGSRDEHSENNGLAHLFEHMAFKGTPSRSGLEIVKSLEETGGQINAFTTKEHTCFYARVAESEVRLALEILLDMIFNPVLDPGDLKKEREIIIEELKGYRDNPEEWVYDLFASALFGDQSMGFPVAGSPKSVRSLQRPQLLNHLKKIRSRVPIYVIAAGGISHRQVVSITRSITGDRSSSRINGRIATGRPRAFTGRRPVTYGNRHLIRNKQVQQANIVMGRGAFPINDRRNFALLILNSILGDGMSSRLFQKLREEYGYVYHISTYIESMINAGLQGIAFNTEPKYLRPTLEALNRELRLLREKGITEEELSFSKRNQKGTFLLEMESTQTRMAFLAKIIMRGGIINSQEKYIQTLESVTLDQVNSVIARLIDSADWALAAVLPTGVKVNTRSLLSF